MDRLEHKDLKQLVERNRGQNQELNAALIVAAAIWGVKAGELSLIEVRDVLTPKGTLRKRWVLRKEVAFNGYARNLYTEHESLVEYLDVYLAFRIRRGQGVTGAGEYRGLDAESRLFLTPDGSPFKFSRRQSGSQASLQPTGMNAYFKRLIMNAGLPGITYKDFRRSLAIQMYREGAGKGVIKEIMQYLGIRSYSAMRKILNSDPKALNDMIKGIHKRI